MKHNGMELAVYKHSAERYNGSYKHNHLVYWGRVHLKMCRVLGKPSLLLPLHDC